MDKALQNVKLEGDTLVITKDKFNGCCYSDVQKLKSTSVKFRVDGVKTLEYGIYEDKNHHETLESTREALDWLSYHFTGDWMVKMSVRTAFCGKFESMIIDLRTVTDHTVKFKKPGEYDKYIFTAEVKFPIGNQKKLTFEIIDSFKTHKVELEVEPTPNWYYNM